LLVVVVYVSVLFVFVYYFFLFSFFFFQAEDGIRDRNVTGVQTCALPICSTYFSIISERLEEELKYVERYIEKSPTPPLNPKEGRSEERRVGKECRDRWWKSQCKKKKKVREMHATTNEWKL